MSIQRDLDELHQLNMEIKRLKGLVKNYTEQKSNVEKRIINFLKSQEQNGVRYNDTAILLEQKNIRNKKKKNEKIEDLHSVLKKYNINGSEAMIQDLIDANKGSQKKNESLKFVKSNK